MKTLKCLALAVLMLGCTSIQNPAMAGTVKSDLVQKTETKTPEIKAAPTEEKPKVDIIKAMREALKTVIEEVRADLAKKTGKKVTVKQVLVAKENVNDLQDAEVVIYDAEGTLIGFVFYRVRGQSWDVFPDSFGTP